MPENQKVKYASEWDRSSEHFYNNNSYSWMCDRIKKYPIVLEIGCGTGQSTLALVRAGHKVIAIEKNIYCLRQAQKRLSDEQCNISDQRGLIDDFDVVFIEGDICTEDFRVSIQQMHFDIVVCWNVGTYWDEEMIKRYAPLLIEYGLTLDQIQAYPESSYGEFIQWMACKIAKDKNVPYHIVDRGIKPLNPWNDVYYKTLKKQFNYSRIKYANKKAITLSQGGRLLVTNQKLNNQKELKICLMSVIIS